MNRSFLYITILLVCSCKTYTNDYNLLLTNNSNIAITYGELYPGNLNRISIGGVLDPGETRRITCGTGKPQSWIPIFNDGPQTFYIFEGKMSGGFLDKYDSDTDIRILARYVFTLDNMIMLGWSFSFPPNEAMKDIPMYPPYSEFAVSSDTDSN